jgi:hypothetical protein
MWLVFLIIAVAVTVYVGLIARNPHPKGTDEHRSLRMCRTGSALVCWGVDLGLFGLAFFLAGFALGVIAIVNGRGAYGTAVVAASVLALPLAFVSFASLFSGATLAGL